MTAEQKRRQLIADALADIREEQELRCKDERET